MNFKIVVDSCADLTPELKNNEHISVVPLTLMVGEHTIIDDDTFDQADFLQKVKACKECPKSACPSPQRFMEECMEPDTNIYILTLSAELSGSHNSATVGRELYIEDGGKNNVYVFNSMAASAGQTSLTIYLLDLLTSNPDMAFQDVVDTMNAHIKENRTYFVLETLDTLRKNGRLTNLQAIIANALNIKPVMSAEDGKIIKLEQTRGMSKALNKMVDVIKANTINSDNKKMVISHCNCHDRALQVKERIESVMKVKEVIIVDTAGVSSLYANEGGIVVGI